MYNKCSCFIYILYHVSFFKNDEHCTKGETVRYSPFNLFGQDSTKSLYDTISSLLRLYSSYYFLISLVFKDTP